MVIPKIFIIIIALGSFYGCTQNGNWEEHLNDTNSPIQNYDSDFVKFVVADGLTNEFKGQDKFVLLNSFAKMYKINDESLLTSEYMKKPNDNTLLSLYLGRKIAWNSFNRGLTKRSSKAIVYDELENFPSKQELLAFYYSEIFIQVLNNQRSISPNEINLDYDSLGLSKLEGDIMFLSAMRHCGSQIQSYSNLRFPDNCHKAMEFESKLPMFDGKRFYEYELAEFDDFLIDVDKNYPKMSFKERYLTEYEGAVLGFRKCQEDQGKS